MTEEDAETFFLTQQRFDLWKEISKFEKTTKGRNAIEGRGMVLSGPQGIYKNFCF
jgi:hypothetical protein